MSEIEVLLAEESDVNALAELSYEVGKMHDEAMPDYFKPTGKEEHLRIISEMLKSETEVVFKAVCGEQICGFLCLWVPVRPRNGFVHARCGVILNMGVAERFRGKGIGTQLIQYAERFLLNRGIDAMELDVFMFNENAKKLYEKMGFKVTEQHMFKCLG